MDNSVFIFASFGLLLSLQGCTSLSSPQLTITPKRLHASPGSSVNILCKSKNPIQQCQFKISNEDIVDLKMGKSTPPTTSYEYYGEGLDKGDCGIFIKGTRLSISGYIISCRVRTETSDWEYAEMTLDNSDAKDVELREEPKTQKIIIQEDGTTNITVKSKLPLTVCFFTFADETGRELLNERINFNNVKTAIVGNQTVEYHGKGLEKGDCGFTLTKQLLEDDIGGVWADIATASESGRHFTRLILEQTQDATLLSMKSETIAAGDLLIATCIVNGSRPQARIEWTFGDEVINTGITSEPLPDNEWGWPSDIQTTTQTLKKIVKKLDNGKKLKCVSQNLVTRSSGSKMVEVVDRPVQRNSGKKLSPRDATVFLMIVTFVVTTR